MFAVKKLVSVGMMLVGLAACAPQVPDSGVGFSDYSQYELDRARAELGQGAAVALPAAPVVGATPLGQVSTSAIPTTDLAAAGIGSTATGGTPLPYAVPAQQPGVVNATPGNAAPVIVNNTGISDEQDFSAVAGRETIESDALRRQQQAAQYEIVNPGAVPTRDGAAGPNIIDFALAAPNVKGQEWYSRFRLSGQGRYDRNCAKYTSPDEAQQAFLSRGGPEKDMMGIDPDGDGFACTWDPAPFLLARTSTNGG